MWLSLGPSTAIEDAATTALRRAAPPDSPHIGLASAALSGIVAGCCVTSQVEHLITAAHARASTLVPTARALARERGLAYMLLPPGMAATAAKEVPFAAACFFARPRLAAAFVDRSGGASLGDRCFRELCCGAACSAVASPVSHAPSVVAAYQQATGASLRGAVATLYAAGGAPTFFRGLAPRAVSFAGTFTVIPLVLDALSRAAGLDPDADH